MSVDSGDGANKRVYYNGIDDGDPGDTVLILGDKSRACYHVSEECVAVHGQQSQVREATRREARSDHGRVPCINCVSLSGGPNLSPEGVTICGVVTRLTAGDRYSDGVPIGVVVDRAEDYGVSSEWSESIIPYLREHGVIEGKDRLTPAQGGSE